MANVQGLKLEDPEGSVMMLTRVEDLVFTVAYALAPGAEVFRLFEEDRAKLREFLRPLTG